MIYDLLTLFNDGVSYAKANAWNIVLLFLSLYILQHFLMKFKIRMSGHSLKSENRGRSGDREEAIRKARERQQQLLNERSKIGEEEMKKKQAQEKERRNQIAKDKAKKEQGSGRRLGGTSSGGYNPLQPSTGMSGGYRPQRRTVNRGGG